MKIFLLRLYDSKCLRALVRKEVGNSVSFGQNIVDNHGQNIVDKFTKVSKVGEIFYR